MFVQQKFSFVHPTKEKKKLRIMVVPFSVSFNCFSRAEILQRILFANAVPFLGKRNI